MLLEDINMWLVRGSLSVRARAIIFQTHKLRGRSNFIETESEKTSPEALPSCHNNMLLYSKYIYVLQYVYFTCLVVEMKYANSCYKYHYILSHPVKTKTDKENLIGVLLYSLT